MSKVVAFLEVHKAFAEEMGTNVDDCAVFWDFGSLFQPERTHDQKVLFREGLRASNVWYGSFCTTVLIQPHLPPMFTATSYTQSGWSFVEATISSVIKNSFLRFDMGASALDSAGNLVMGPSLRAPQARRRSPPEGAGVSATPHPTPPGVSNTRTGTVLTRLTRQKLLGACLREGRRGVT